MKSEYYNASLLNGFRIAVNSVKGICTERNIRESIAGSIAAE